MAGLFLTVPMTGMVVCWSKKRYAPSLEAHLLELESPMFKFGSAALGFSRV